MRVVLVSALSLVATVLACSGDRFDEECPPGTVEIGTTCAVTGKAGAAGVGAMSGAAGSAGGSAGSAGSGSSSGAAGNAAGSAGSPAGAAGAGGNAGASGAGAGAGGGSGAGATGKGGAGAAGGGAGGAGSGGAPAGAGGMAGDGGKAGGSAGGNGGAGTGGQSGMAGASGGAAGSGGTAGVAGAAGTAGTGGGGAGGDGTAGTAGGGAGGGPECVDTDVSCSGAIPRTCQSGQWVGGAACEIGCDAGACVSVVSLSARNQHACALLSNGRVRCWGSSSSDMFGTEGLTVAKVPVEIPGITGATGLALGDEHACARTAKGEVWCWGNNAHKQLGTLSPVAKSAAPVKVANLPAAGSIAAISDRSCAVTIGGEVWCWGQFPSAAPASIGGPTGSVQIAVGDQFTCARTSKDEVWCWGDNGTGQCGNGNTTSPVATPVAVGPKVSDIQAGLYHACGITNNGAGVYCWGANDQGQTGTSLTEASVLVPTSAPGTLAVTAIAVGVNSVLARTADGKVLCWGHGENEECLEAGLGAKVMQPTVVPSLQGGITFTTGASSCVLTAPSTVACWGSMSLVYPGQSQGADAPLVIAWK